MADPEVEASFLILVLGPETEVLFLIHSSCWVPQCVILVLKPLVPALWGLVDWCGGGARALLWSPIREGRDPSRCCLSFQAAPSPSLHPSSGLSLNGLEWCGGGDPGPWVGVGVSTFCLSFLPSGCEFHVFLSPDPGAACWWCEAAPAEGPQVHLTSYPAWCWVPSLLLLLSRFSRVRLYATPSTAAHQAPPSRGFSRQEYWSGVPLPSPNRDLVFNNSE